jgi:ribulose-5-phosphate 4-epimerase/fuculose-1-phosphate aldolase
MTGSLIGLAHRLSGFVVGYEGNVSCRLDDKRFLIKGSGRRLSCLSESDLVECEQGGTHYGDLRPSMEVEFHSHLLSLPGVNFVAHTHPTNTMKLLCTSEAETFADKRIFPDQVVFNGARSALVDYVHPGPELAAAIREGVSRFVLREGAIPQLILLRNHGIVTLGETAEQCLVATEICEKAAEILSGCRGTPTFLTDSQVHMIVGDDREAHRKKMTSQR